jgi:mRNA-degrading endonuclease RelE of RelBE toxin-antitoxin system
MEVLQGDLAPGLRLRLGDYRVLFSLKNDVMRIFGVRHRSQAYQ